MPWLSKSRRNLGGGLTYQWLLATMAGWNLQLGPETVYLLVDAGYIQWGRALLTLLPGSIWMTTVWNKMFRQEGLTHNTNCIQPYGKALKATSYIIKFHLQNGSWCALKVSYLTAGDSLGLFELHGAIHIFPYVCRSLDDLKWWRELPWIFTLCIILAFPVFPLPRSRAKAIVQ